MLTEQLANLLNVLWARPVLAPEVEAKARLLMLDTLGCAIAGAAAPEPAALAQRLSRPDAPVRLPGFPPLDVAPATLVLTAAACWDEACEGLARAHGRPGLHTLPLVVARALADGRTLGEALVALVTGFEVAGRLGEVLRIKPGMHVDGTWGAFGAAAGLARLLGLDARQALTAVNALACSLPYSLYLPIRRGTMNRNLYSGQAGVRALETVEAVAAGIEAPNDGLDEMAQLMLGLDPAALVLAPASQNLILEGYLKPFAAVRHVHYPAAAAIDWRKRHGARAGDITSLHLHIYGEAITYCGNRAPRTPIQAQFSLSWGTAWALLNGDLGPEAFRPSALADPNVRRLEAMIEIAHDEACDEAGRRAARLEIGLGSERTESMADHVAGDPALPMTSDDVVGKFLRYAGGGLGAETARGLARRLLDSPLEMPIKACLGIHLGSALYEKCTIGSG